MARTPPQGYRHATAQRSRAPNEEERSLMTDADVGSVPYVPPRCVETGGPRLSWQRSAAGEQPTMASPLYIQERIHPSEFVHKLTKPRAADTRFSFFDDFNNLPDDAKYKWYQHQGNWSNRLIRGPALEVMASLIVKDDLAGKVQCIFFDPPYGISFKSLYQQSTRSRNEVRGMGAANAEQRLAFRDTYENGVHSYLDNIHRIARHAHELLTESGSFFLQISQKNVHRLALVLDEVFGEDNRVATVMFAKSGSTSAKALPEVNDYLLWYCKDRDHLKYHQLYEPLNRKAVIDHFTSYAMLELPDGTERSLTPEEKADPEGAIPEGARIFRRMPLLSSHHSTTGRSEPFEWNGRVYPCPPDKQWSVSHEGLERLARYEPSRLTSASKESALLGWKAYEQEVPGKKIHNLWRSQMSPSDIRYVVETAESVLERCICMTTDPGDLVLDPTCGSGTTAFIAEKFGRRWITSDVSGISLALTRHRLITGVFDWYLTQGSSEGERAERELGGQGLRSVNVEPDDPATGFVYPRVPKVSAKILAYDEKATPTPLVDRPIKSQQAGRRRVASPFTVETHSPHRYLTIDQALGEVGKQKDSTRDDVDTRIIEALAASGARLSNGERVLFEDIVPVDGYRVLTHRCREAGSCVPDTGLAVFGPDEMVNRFAERRAADEATASEVATTLLLIGFGFESGPKREQRGRIAVHRVQAHQDLRIPGLALDSAADALVVVAEPDIDLRPTAEGQWTLEVKGFDSYNPAAGQVAPHQGIDDIECLMIDTNYDGSAFFARAIHFPGQGEDSRLKRLKKHLGSQLDPERWAICLSARSAPFPAPESGEVAVRLITCTGAELTTTRSLPPHTHAGGL